MKMGGGAVSLYAPPLSFKRERGLPRCPGHIRLRACQAPFSPCHGITWDEERHESVHRLPEV